jgi:oligoendopeptidase F
VKLEVPIVRLVIKDLVTFDGLKLQLVETEKLLQLSDKKIILKDSIITNMETKVVNFETIITKKDEQFSLERQKSESLLKELKQEKRKGFFYKIGSGIGAAAIILLLVK